MADIIYTVYQVYTWVKTESGIDHSKVRLMENTVEWSPFDNSFIITNSTLLRAAEEKHTSLLEEEAKQLNTNLPGWVKEKIGL